MDSNNQTEILDLDLLGEACAELGAELLPDTPVRGYAGVTREAFRTLRLQGPYDIAVDPVDGRYVLTAEWWGGFVAREVGIGFDLLLQRYRGRTARRGESVVRTPAATPR